MQPALMKNQATVQGDGLWCITKEEQTQYKRFAEKVVHKKQVQMENRLESIVVQGLEEECRRLGQQLETVHSKLKEVMIENQMIRSQQSGSNKSQNQQMVEICNLKNSNQMLEDLLEDLKQKYNVTKRNEQMLQNQLEDEQAKFQMLEEEYNSIKSKTDIQLDQYQSELRELKQRYEEQTEEFEELRSNLQVKQTLYKEIDNQKAEYYKNQEDQLVQDNRQKSMQILKLQEQKQDLINKLSEVEIQKKNYIQLKTSLEKDNVQLGQDLKQNQEEFKQMKKRLLDLQSLKSKNQKINEQKIKQLDQQLIEVLEENRKLKVLVQNKRTFDFQQPEEEVIEEVKPVSKKLFGSGK